MATLTVIEPQSGQNNASEPTGRVLVSGDWWQYGDEVRPDDLLAVNFDVKRVYCSSLYLLEEVGGSWHGCRRINQELSGLDIQDDVNDTWVRVQSVEEIGFRVIGRVEAVYRPTNAR